jgi:DNA-binding NarL/FixJ family response regulator
MSACNPALPGTHISVAVAHKDPLVRVGLQATLAGVHDFDVSLFHPGAAAGGPVPDVLVADYETALTLFAAVAPVTPVTPACCPARARMPRVMVVSHRDRETEIRNALDLGVCGYLLLGCGLDEMVFGVRALHRGQRHLDRSAAQRVAESLGRPALTGREDAVLRLIAVGHVNKIIASELGITVGTVKAHVKAILAKFGAKTRTEAAALAQQRGLCGRVGG